MITDHALRRYIERVMGFDLAPLEARILAEISETVRRVEESGVADGLVWAVRRPDAVYVIAGGRVITVFAPTAMPRLGQRGGLS